MIWRGLVRHVLAVLAYAAAHAQTPAPAAVGYVGWWLPAGWKTVAHLPLQRLFFFDIPISDSGALQERRGWPQAWTELQAFAREKRLPIDLTLTLMDSRAFHRVFSNPAAVERLLNEASTLAEDPSCAGIQLDVEMYTDLLPADIAAFRGFVLRLGARLQKLPAPKGLGIFLPFQSKSLLYDTTTLRNVQYVVVQGYDAHWLESQHAGPVAPLDGPYGLTWAKALAYADSLGVPRSSQFLSYPLYGYEWRVKDTGHARAATIGKGVITTFAAIPPLAPVPQAAPSIDAQTRVAQHGATHDPQSAASYYRFKSSDGVRWEGWFEDWWGIQRKRRFAADNQTAGLAFFLLGYDQGLLVDYFVRSTPQHGSEQTTKPDNEPKPYKVPHPPSGGEAPVQRQP